MKKFYAISLALLAGVASATASDFSKVKTMGTEAAPVVAPLSTLGTVSLDYMVSANYDGINFEPRAGYYLVMSSAADAVYNSNEGTVTATNGWVLALDLYNNPTDGPTLEPGTYKLIDDPYPAAPDAFSMVKDYSLAQHYDAEGNIDVEFNVSGDAVVTRGNDDIYTITVPISDANGDVVEFTYSGRLPFVDPSHKTSIYRQIREDRTDIQFKGGMAFYYGQFQTTKGGTMMVQLYDGEYSEDGMQYDETQMICLDLIARNFADESKITIDPGTYIISPLGTLQRNQAGAAAEVNYMGQTVVLGTYLRDRSRTKYGEDLAAYSYLKTGTITVEAIEGGYRIQLLDGVTDLGYKVTFTYEGPVGPIMNYAADSGKSALSTIEDDVDLKLDDLPIARVWNSGTVNGCQVFTLDIGSRSGRDPERDNGGDIMRLEIVNPAGTTHIEPGSYTIMAERWDTFYQPFTLAQTHWVSASSGGSDISGTCYMHFIEGRSYVMDHYAFLTEGKMGLTVPEGTEWPSDPKADRVYSFNMDFVADNSFFVRGQWTGPVHLMYNPDELSAIGAIEADGSDAKLAMTSPGIYRVANYTGSVMVYNVAGIAVGTFDASQPIDLSAQPAGIYIFKIGNKSIKAAK